MENITVVGAGPIGLQVANNLKREGFDVTVIEEHNVVGKPVNCSGLISKSGVDELGLKLEDCAVNEIYGAKIFAPNNDSLTVMRQKPVAYVIDRFKFDQIFYREAKRIGLRVKTNTKLLDIRGEKLFIQSEGRGELWKSNLVVGADGVTSTVRHLLFEDVPKDHFVHSIQGTCAGSFDPKIVQLHFGKFAPGFFAWVIPENRERARIGLGASAGSDVEDLFRHFLIEKEINAKLLGQKASFLIPVGPPLKSAKAESAFLAGDAAFHTKATTGGGLMLGLQAANFCSKTIEDFLKYKTPLKNYDTNLLTINRELQMHWKLRSYLNSLSNEKISELFSKLKKAGLEEFLQEEGHMDKPSHFVGKLAKKPAYWFLLPQLMKMLRG